MKLLALNILQGGGTRINSIYSYLKAQNCDLLVISKFRRNARGTELIAMLRLAGYSQFYHNNTEPRQSTVMLATKQSGTTITINNYYK